MTTSEIYQLAVEIGLSTDCKEKNEIEMLVRQKFPYPDSLILYAKEERKIKKIAVGIDINCFDIFFAKNFLKCDLVISHHPLSRAANQMPEVVFQQTANLVYYGLDKNQVNPLIKEAAEKLRRTAATDNFYCEEQTARHLDIDLMCLHTVADNVAVFILKKIIADKNCHTLGDFVKSLIQIKEFKMASEIGQPPFITKGREKELLGKVSFSEFVGGQESSPEIFAEMEKSGIETIVVPHLSEEFFASACQAGLKVIYCGHLASDSLGMNYILDRIKEKEKIIKIIPLGGFLRLEEK